MERIRIFIDVDPYTTTKKTRVGKSPLQLACLAHRHLEIKQYLQHKVANVLFRSVEADKGIISHFSHVLLWGWIRPHNIYLQ
jgi:hypothetical protein